MTCFLQISCSSDECLDNRNSLPLAGFYSSVAMPNPISIDSISVYGVNVPGNAMLLDSANNVSETYLPFSIDSKYSEFVIKYLSSDLSSLGISDTIAFDYEVIPYFVSSACGAIYKYKINSIQHTKFVIDSVTCPSNLIDNIPGQNINIYFRMTEGDAGGN